MSMVGLIDKLLQVLSVSKSVTIKWITGDNVESCVTVAPLSMLWVET